MLSATTVLVNVPANKGCSACVVILLNAITLEIIAVALELKLPSLSTAFRRYVPCLAGTVIEVAGLDTFSTKDTEFCQSAVPSISSLNLKL